MISVSIITKNEEKNIEACLQSVQWADEIIVVDSGSTDRTLEICESYHCQIIETPWLGFGKTKQIGVNAASHNWVLSLDADERVSDELREHIVSLVSSTSYQAFHIKRNSYYLGKQIKYSGWQTDCPLRLFDKRYGNFDDATVHESVSLTSGQKSQIESTISHYPFPDIDTHIKKINHYSRLGAQALFDQGKNTSLIYALFSGLIKFIKTYVIKLGFLDGARGFVLALLSGFNSTLKYLKLWSLRRAK